MYKRANTFADVSAYVTLSEPADQELLQRASQGDREALGVLYDRHGDVMYGLAVRLLGGAEDAGDLVHDVLLEAWQRADQYDAAKASVRSWLILRLRSRAIDRQRAAKVRDLGAYLDPLDDQELLQTEEQASFSQMGADHGAAVEKIRLSKCLAQLSEQHRTVLTLAYFQGLSCREIALRTSTPVSTIKSRLTAATQKMRVLLDVSGGQSVNVD